MDISKISEDRAPDLGATADTPMRARWSIVVVFWGIIFFILLALSLSFVYFRSLPVTEANLKDPTPIVGALRSYPSSITAYEI